MNSALKHTMIAMATAALTVSAGCKSDDGPEATEDQQRSHHERDIPSQVHQSRPSIAIAANRTAR